MSKDFFAHRNELRNEETSGQRDERTERRTNRETNEQRDERTDRRTDKDANGQTGERTERRTEHRERQAQLDELTDKFN